MIKKLLILTTLILSLPCHACLLTYSTDEEMAKIIHDEKFDFDRYDEVCSLLEKAKAGVDIRYISQITPYQTSVAINIRLYDASIKEGLVYSDLGRSHINYDSEKSSEAEKALLYKGLMALLNGINQEYVDSLNENRKSLHFSTFP